MEAEAVLGRGQTVLKRRLKNGLCSLIGLDGGKMAKTLAYVVSAILLGVVAMLPVMMLTPQRTDEGYYAFHGNLRLQAKADVESLQKLEEVGTAAVPSGPFHTWLILVIGLVSAFGVSFYFKRKML